VHHTGLGVSLKAQADYTKNPRKQFLCSGFGLLCKKQCHLKYVEKDANILPSISGGAYMEERSDAAALAGGLRLTHFPTLVGNTTEQAYDDLQKFAKSFPALSDDERCVNNVVGALGAVSIFVVF
jgi:hypothetical protein